jgi:dephospho-CoA kinase
MVLPSSPNAKAPLQIGVTGGIGSGKSIVCRVLKIMGIPVFESDLVSRQILNTNPFVISQVKRLFGEVAYNPDGSANRSFIASAVFENRELLLQLNAIIHPAVKAAYTDWVALNKDERAVVKEAAIMFESGSNNGLDYVIAIAAPEELRISRVMKRSSLTYERVQQIISQQLSDSERQMKSDFTIINDEKIPVLKQLLDILVLIMPVKN